MIDSSRSLDRGVVLFLYVTVFIIGYLEHTYNSRLSRFTSSRAILAAEVLLDGRGTFQWKLLKLLR